jgi:hypothetical protein
MSGVGVSNASAMGSLSAVHVRLARTPARLVARFSTILQLPFASVVNDSWFSRLQRLYKTLLWGSDRIAKRVCAIVPLLGILAGPVIPSVPDMPKPMEGRQWNDRKTQE